MKKQTRTAGRQVTYPVANLRAQVTALEEAVAQVLAKPRKNHVHALRKATRRIEAQLEIVSALSIQEPGFAAAHKPAGRVRKLLRQVRRSAGTVRDLDVQRELAQQVSSGAKGRSLRRQSKDLRHAMKLERKVQAFKLLQALEAHALQLEPKLEKLLRKLEPVAEVGLSGTDLEALVREWYAGRRSKAEREKQPATRMHGVRKAAKLARYMADDGGAKGTVTDFETIQETGGRWHDTLNLRDAARDRLGKQSRLARLLTDQEKDARTGFRELLAE